MDTKLSNNLKVNLHGKSLDECKEELKNIVFQIISTPEWACTKQGCHYRIVYRRLPTICPSLCDILLNELIADGKVYPDAKHSYYKSSTW